VFSIAPATVFEAVTTKNGPSPQRVRFALVGAGWRSTVFLRMAYLMPERFEVVGVVTRRPESGAEIEQRWGVPTYRDIDTLLAAGRPDFTLLSVPWELTPQLIRHLVALEMPVLAETPPAPDAEGLRSLWHDVGGSGLVQVAEQYALMPLHAARLSAVRSGVIGSPTSVLVSSTHGYHAVSLMRQFLGAGSGPVTVRAATFGSALADPIDPKGWRHDLDPRPAENVLATLDFGEGRTGRYDFTTNQWWNPLRPDHLLVRGSAGEISDETVVRMADEVTPLTSQIVRASSGLGMNYEGLDLTHISLDGTVLFRNEFEGARLSDDDIGVAELLSRTGRWVLEGGEPPYPLADACQDHLVSLAIDEAAATGAVVQTEVEAWSTPSAG
jgi:predicted dehydrogenase